MDKKAPYFSETMTYYELLRAFLRLLMAKQRMR